MIRIFGLSVLFFVLWGCGITATRPKYEMSVSQAAFMAAKEAKADEIAPNLFRKAEIYYLKAKSAYRRKYFNKARDYALASKKYSEQAEYMAIKKAALGEK